MDGLLFSRSVLQKELGFRPDQIDYLFAFPGARVRDADGVKTGYFKALVSFKKDPATEELRHTLSAIRLGGATGTVFYVGQPRRCRKFNLEGHLAKDCTAPFCTKCRSTGHEVEDCLAEKTCNLCGSTEHGFKNCLSSYTFKIKAAQLEQPFTLHQSRGRSREDVEAEEEELIRLGLEEERFELQPGLSMSEEKVDITVEQDTSGKGAPFLEGKQAGAVDEAGKNMEHNEEASPGAPDLPIMAPTPELDLAVQSDQTSSKSTRVGVAQHHLCAAERNDIISAGGSSLISNTGAAIDTPQVQLVPQPSGTDEDDSLYGTPKVFSTLSQHTLETSLSGTANAIDTQVPLSTIPSTDSGTEIEYACKTLEQSSFSDTAVAGVFVQRGTDGTIIGDEVEAAIDVSTSLKRKMKEGDYTEETGFESNDPRDLWAQGERCDFQAAKGEDSLSL
ncbi:hypothetical protein NDU88_006741 [Pleurodeles waltl]|uniref:CCHC-type domain-containing protein n=1 Tax=Pleurodeles waltl TaxID=8319 RepID=A0AAV7UNN4_PLEWA|nr:hypothetical protein NDU88_006741 [Pleurodeles waltl]